MASKPTDFREEKNRVGDNRSDADHVNADKEHDIHSGINKKAFPQEINQIEDGSKNQKIEKSSLTGLSRSACVQQKLKSEDEKTYKDNTLIVLGVKAKQSNAIKKLEEKIIPLIIKKCYSSLDNRNEILTVSRDIFTKVVMEMHTLKEPRALMGWVSTITYNHILIINKGKKREASFKKNYHDHLKSQDNPHYEKTTNQVTFKELLSIVPSLEDRKLLYERFHNDYTYTQIAEILDLKEETIKKRMQRLLTKIEKPVKRYMKMNNLNFGEHKNGK